MSTLRGRRLLKLPDQGLTLISTLLFIGCAIIIFLIKEVDAAVSPYRLRRIKAIDEVP